MTFSLNSVFGYKRWKFSRLRVLLQHKFIYSDKLSALPLFCVVRLLMCLLVTAADIIFFNVSFQDLLFH